MRFLIDVGLLAVLLCHVADADNLILVQAVWRHGDRSPTSTFPTDTNGEDKWPQGWGQLTTIGMQQHYVLGARLRKLYDGFISSTYKAGEIYVRSTDYDRTLMSAMSNLAGFYPNGVAGVNFPSATDVPGWPTSWSPVPVHTVEFSTDKVGYPLFKCARADQLYELIQQGDSYKTITAENQQFFVWLTNVTGFTEPVTLENLYLIEDVLMIEKLHNVPLPSWCTDTIYQKIVTLNNLADDFLFGLGNPRVPELIKLRGGSLLKDITDRMNTKVACLRNSSSIHVCSALNKLKYYAYSAHDVTVDGLLATLGDKEQVVGGGLPLYAASIVLELWNTSSGPQVKIQYHPTFNTSFYTITNLTRGCNTTTDYCALDTFVARSQIFIPNNITVDCQRQYDASSTSTSSLTTPSTAAKIAIWSIFSTQTFFSAIALLFAAVNRSGYFGH